MNIKDKLRRIQRALDTLSVNERECRLCPRECGVDRKKGEKGFCQSGNLASVSHTLLHYGEEPVLSGSLHENDEKKETPEPFTGSGTVFLSGCNLKCVYCQNYQLSWLNQGKAVTDKQLSERILELQHKGALNINFVSPSHMILPVLRALKISYAEGLHLPVVYNSNAYEKKEVIECLDGIIDIYLPDLKYCSLELADRYSGAPDYFHYASQAVKEMYFQQPSMHLSRENVAAKGLIIRHLVLPGQTADSLAVLEWIASNLSLSICLSLMSQYHPCHEAPQDLRKNLSVEEYHHVTESAQKLGFENLFVQTDSFDLQDHLIPDFDLESPFKWD